MEQFKPGDICQICNLMTIDMDGIANTVSSCIIPLYGEELFFDDVYGDIVLINEVVLTYDDDVVYDVDNFTKGYSHYAFHSVLRKWTNRRMKPSRIKLEKRKI